MAPLTFALVALLTASLASAGPVALDNATLLSNGQQAQLLNCGFQTLQTRDPCNTGETACIQKALASCVNNAWQTQLCPSSKTCFALPQIRANGTFVACTSQNNAASIIAAAGAQGGIASSNCTSNNATSPGTATGGNNATTVTVTVTEAASTVLTLPPTTTTLSPDQASSLLSSLSANALSSPVPSAPAPSAGNANGLAGSPPAVIQLTSRSVSSLALTVAPTPSSTGYPY